MVEQIDGWMDGWTDAVLTLGFFLDILHVRKVAKKIPSFQSTQQVVIRMCAGKDGRMNGWMDRQKTRTF